MLEKDQAVLAEVREVNADIRKDAGEIRKNSCGMELLKENLSDFSTAGMLFAEVTADVMAETEDLFSLSGCCDRFSPQYLMHASHTYGSISSLDISTSDLTSRIR